MQRLIFNQHEIPKNQLRYGLRASASVGCGWIATYNAMELMGYHVEPENLIRYYERQLPVIHGNLGTSFWGPAVCFRQWGFPTEVIFHRKKFDEAARNASVCVLFYRWRNGAKIGAHFVALQHTQNGLIGYNTYNNSKGPDRYGRSLEEFLRRRRYFGAVLIAIHDNKKGPAAK